MGPGMVKLREPGSSDTISAMSEEMREELAALEATIDLMIRKGVLSLTTSNFTIQLTQGALSPALDKPERAKPKNGASQQQQDEDPDTLFWSTEAP